MSELRNKLLQRQFDSEEVADVVEYLIAEDYLSNERFAESTLRQRVNKGYGWRYIENELRQKGVESSTINKLNKIEEIDWYLQAELAYNKRFGSSEIVDQKDKAKRVRFLQSRGYATEEIMAALNAIK